MIKVKKDYLNLKKMFTERLNEDCGKAFENLESHEKHLFLSLSRNGQQRKGKNHGENRGLRVLKTNWAGGFWPKTRNS